HAGAIAALCTHAQPGRAAVELVEIWSAEQFRPSQRDRTQSARLRRIDRGAAGSGVPSSTLPCLRPPIPADIIFLTSNNQRETVDRRDKTKEKRSIHRFHRFTRMKRNLSLFTSVFALLFYSCTSV